jgi:nitrogen fixation/metabolism regulation signal transduction histidine kinase
MSKVMDRISRGDLGARAPRLGEDELGRLAADFNGMLDELDAARDRLGYLERIAAWQEMARRIAHEIKNPLTPIQLAVQQIREKDPGTDPRFTRLVRDSTEIVEDEIAGLRRMVTSFSQFARVPEVQLERIELRRVVEEFVRAYGHLTERDDDALEFAAAEAGVEVQGDRQLLKQVLVNLVENAVLSAKEAAVSPIRVRVSVDSAGARARILVDDNGPGIAAARRERVFEPYETTRAEGTGLGLAIVKKIVLDHGGSVRAEASPLGGARIVIELPRASAGGEPRRRTAPPMPAAPTSAPSEPPPGSPVPPAR